MLVRLASINDRLRSSLFFVPMLFVVGGGLLGELLLKVDQDVDGIPSRLTATVDSARGVLSVVAGATLTFAGIAFSVSLLLISLTSSQYSPRVVHGLFRDPFNKRVMGVVVGTFTYCLVVLRAVRGPLEDEGQAIVPSISILVAVVLGIVSVLSIIAFISHAAHMMDVSKILHSVTEETIERTRDAWSDEDDGGETDEGEPPGDGHPIVFDRHGWVQQVDLEALFEALEPGACLRLDTAPGRYAIPDTPLCTIWPRPDDDERADRQVRSAVIIGETRTMQQDVAYGVRQLSDVALKALSPGVNDPTTAQDALFHLAAALREMLVRRPPARVLTGDDERRILRPQEVCHEDLIDMAFNEVRVAAAGMPTIGVYLLEILYLLTVSLAEDRAVGDALARQAELILELSELADLPARDHERVRTAYERRFGSNHSR